MRALKGKVSGVPGSELLSALLNPDGSKPKLDDCVAQVATIQIGDSSVMAVALAPKSAFEIDGKPAAVSGKHYGWHRRWSRVMVWRPEGAENNGRAEATIQAELMSRLMIARLPWEAVVSLCREVFGEKQEHALRGLMCECKETGEPVTQNRIDGVTTRPIEASEFEEISALVPEEWKPVLERRANWNVPEWREVENARMGSRRGPSAGSSRASSRGWALSKLFRR
ncbi:hypothetical protein GNI_165590 [Gregarina niphandrodes]|uniref:Uncharacterized protein n=1 Tax=Gregarina niphandrodes TaxID=110365 RepID=A0A023AY50_GRENI|nr:hypothetical protein GNI_165590 [Gregarina niphandrodes]EZG43584.1 hypothetical protein GNI_165590 [Gregarina niphandrodes]|eukprot:XP_011133192.1 hypothetical protein GNI_165590 [Gregarina niphandrodes]